MLLEAIVGILLFIPNLLFSMLPTIEFTIPDNILSGVSDIFAMVGYFFPIAALLPILVMSLALDMFRIVVAIVVRIKSFIPGMGA